jgi:hypothetical protein
MGLTSKLSDVAFGSDSGLQAAHLELLLLGAKQSKLAVKSA